MHLLVIVLSYNSLKNVLRRRGRMAPYLHSSSERKLIDISKDTLCATLWHYVYTYMSHYSTSLFVESYFLRLRFCRQVYIIYTDWYIFYLHIYLLDAKSTTWVVGNVRKSAYRKRALRVPCLAERWRGGSTFSLFLIVN